ncbi:MULTISPECIES: histidine phosphatase family protein [Ferroplasma]|jgi:probable phosphoglycerate mutase|uniref:Phosphoglycerate mutase n=2 Tax=Ferroplasma TaxID=74968 RepID=S0ANA5_FERAC|nr:MULTISPECIES: histidine phosphatase family protein [Ferroplasma]MCL4349120.1 histidine phosphatase family protein [Candidatus Thermoplasmatota archaeon]AGO60232.1 phosphoglycerate mutase [Ferroplasma acidarmanus Fer1]ARD85045.1 phosphoglycerate mutase [Ferroplasma acidiphilum]NOL60265.1 histidine phosphatase family protein [Ferroplasma acidiphilum]WMT53984.1 MAG: histidine phosphatase family protein [Ferroplasma acidiphilum]
MLVYMVRHGETYNNASAVFPLDDTELNENGLEQARETGKYLEQLYFDAVYSSPVLRVKQTLENMGIDRYITDNRLRDIGTGKLTGMKITEIESKDPAWYSTFQDGVENRYGVEKFSDLKKRVKEFIGSISGNGFKKVLIATHLEPIRGMYSLSTGVEGLPLTSLEISNCSISIFSVEGFDIELKGFNWLPLNNYPDRKNKSFN